MDLSIRDLCVFRDKSPLRFGLYELVRHQWRVYVVRALILTILIWQLGRHFHLWLALVAVEAFLWAITFKTRAHEPNIFRLTGDARLFEFVPGISFRYYYPARNLWGRDRAVEVRVGPQGLREPLSGGVDSTAATRILFIGDSATFGEGVSLHEAYPAVVVEELKSSLGGDGFAFLNAAVPGYNTCQAVASLPRLISRFVPAFVLLGVTMEDSLPWGRIEIGEDGEMMRLDAPLRHKVREYLKSLSYVLYHLSQVYRFARIEEYTRSLFRQEFVGFRKWQEAVGRMASICRDAKVIPIVAIIPGLWKLESGYPWRDVHAIIRDSCESEGIFVADPLRDADTESLEGRPSKELWVHPTDPHPNAEAHGIIGRAIAAEIRPLLEKGLAWDGHASEASEC
ncbi:MAG: hypothetical protein JW759_08120 [Candidatus Coatesbacteria bacterium]|nr:hypothetical protein [Candidatus Coatesbacteria bacterium]